jgi:alpha-N-arabinofuranosidase
VETNHFGTHDFLDFCAQVGCEPYIVGNLGSGTVQEMQEWVEYLNYPGDSPMTRLRARNGRLEPWGVRYWGIGNETWGVGGWMRPEYSADVYRHYQGFVFNYGRNRLYKIACGAAADDYRWTETLMKLAGIYMKGLSLHYYTLPVDYDMNQPFIEEDDEWFIMMKKTSATDFQEDAWFKTIEKSLKMDEYITNHSKIMDRYDPSRKVSLVVDEWGTWYDVEPGTNPRFLFQQNTLRDAMIAGLTLNTFNKHSERVRIANIAQLVNVLQALVLTDHEAMVLTPTYHVYEMFSVHQDATLVHSYLDDAGRYTYGERSIVRLAESASRDADGCLNITLCNPDPHNGEELRCEILGMKARSVSGRILTAARINDFNAFGAAPRVRPVSFHGAAINEGGFSAEIPPKSIVALSVREGP